MSDGVLPAAPVLPVEGEVVHDVVVDIVEGELLAGGALDGHGDECDVGEGRPLVDLHEPVAGGRCAAVGRGGGRGGGDDGGRGARLALTDHLSQEGESHGAGVVDGAQQGLLLEGQGCGGCGLQGESGHQQS